MSVGAASDDFTRCIASLIVVPRAQCSDAAEHMPLAERMAGRESRAAGLHAALLGHALGHDGNIVKKLCYFRVL